LNYFGFFSNKQERREKRLGRFYVKTMSAESGKSRRQNKKSIAAISVQSENLK
jgi:hypothetical protein